MSNLPSHSTRVYLNERPERDVIPGTTFKTEKVLLSSLQPSKPTDVLVRVDYVSIDPAMRGWLDLRRSYIAPVEIGATMRAAGVGTVVAVHSQSSGALKPGDAVKGYFGWTEYGIFEEKRVEKLSLSPGISSLDFLGPLGDTGKTAYFGLLDVAKIKAGDICVVSGAAGAVGSAACQIAKIKGAKVIAIAGGSQKCKWLEEELGVDKALDYKSSSFAEDFKKHVGYLDVYFDNVGGEILDLCLGRLKQGARIALCGAISDYGKTPSGLKGYLNLISQRATLQGFIVFDYADRYAEAEAEMAKWMAEGKLKRHFHVVQGLEKCPEYLTQIFKGVNTGKLVVQVSEQPVASKL